MFFADALTVTRPELVDPGDDSSSACTWADFGGAAPARRLRGRFAGGFAPFAGVGRSAPGCRGAVAVPGRPLRGRGLSAASLSRLLRLPRRGPRRAGLGVGLRGLRMGEEGRRSALSSAPRRALARPSGTRSRSHSACRVPPRRLSGARPRRWGLGRLLADRLVHPCEALLDHSWASVRLGLQHRSRSIRWRMSGARPRPAAAACPSRLDCPRCVSPTGEVRR